MAINFVIGFGEIEKGILRRKMLREAQPPQFVLFSCSVAERHAVTRCPMHQYARPAELACHQCKQFLAVSRGVQVEQLLGQAGQHPAALRVGAIGIEGRMFPEPFSLACRFQFPMRRRNLASPVMCQWIRPAETVIDSVAEMVPEPAADITRRVRIIAIQLSIRMPDRPRHQDVDFEPAGMGMRAHERVQTRCVGKPGMGHREEELQRPFDLPAQLPIPRIERGDGDILDGKRQRGDAVAMLRAQRLQRVKTGPGIADEQFRRRIPRHRHPPRPQRLADLARHQVVDHRARRSLRRGARMRRPPDDHRRATASFSAASRRSMATSSRRMAKAREVSVPETVRVIRFI